VGCPWPDTDKDGLLDKDDRCPKTPGPKANQGCPWNDRDGDGLIDPKDRCPRRPGPKANQGCPWPDSDGDGIIDPKDRCPNDPGPKANRGCPWPDTDRDGLLDKDDKCPKQPGPKSNKGCPLVVINKKVRRIYILKKIFFAFNKASIKPESYPVLDAVANILNRYKSIHIRIEGHTDDVGSRSYNRKLSKRRAASVRRYLSGKGISLFRMTSRGYGESRPLAGGPRRFTKTQLAKNRRVEFHITRQ
jgi:outer membrane protein OmpA-like peptidoglycan-associated protein